MPLWRCWSKHPNGAVALVGEIDLARVVYRYGGWSRELCFQSRAPVAAEPAHSIARDCAYDSRSSVHPSYPVIQGIRDVEISEDVDSHCRRIIQPRAGGRSTIAGICALAHC